MAALDLSVITNSEATEIMPTLVDLLVDSVDHGASVGYLAPMDAKMAEKYWKGVIGAVGEGDRVLLIARLDGRIVGTGQLSLERRPNGDHRGEISKVLVHSSARRQGIGRAIMLRLEEIARENNRELLVLDTVEGDAGERLYLTIGYVSAGLIPHYAKASRGGVEATNVMYKLLV